MKKLLAIFLITGAFAACNNNKHNENATDSMGLSPTEGNTNSTMQQPIDSTHNDSMHMKDTMHMRDSLKK